MAGDGERLVTAETVERLAHLAALPLSADRRAQVAEDLERLLADANAVNRFMEGLPDVAPAVRFHDPELDGAPR